jgi:type I restriction enzyme M protein
MARPSIDVDAKTFLSELRRLKMRVGNGFFRDHLGWREERYWRIREFLLEQGKIIRGRGRGGSVDVA